MISAPLHIPNKLCSVILSFFCQIIQCHQHSLSNCATLPQALYHPSYLPSSWLSFPGFGAIPVVTHQPADQKHLENVVFSLQTCPSTDSAVVTILNLPRVFQTTANHIKAFGFNFPSIPPGYHFKISWGTSQSLRSATSHLILWKWINSRPGPCQSTKDAGWEAAQLEVAAIIQVSKGSWEIRPLWWGLG